MQCFWGERLRGLIETTFLFPGNLCHWPIGERLPHSMFGPKPGLAPVDHDSKLWPGVQTLHIYTCIKYPIKGFYGALEVRNSWIGNKKIAKCSKMFGNIVRKENTSAPINLVRKKITERLRLGSYITGEQNKRNTIELGTKVWCQSGVGCLRWKLWLYMIKIGIGGFIYWLLIVVCNKRGYT